MVDQRFKSEILQPPTANLREVGMRPCGLVLALREYKFSRI